MRVHIDSNDCFKAKPVRPFRSKKLKLEEQHRYEYRIGNSIEEAKQKHWFKEFEEECTDIQVYTCPSKYVCIRGTEKETSLIWVMEINTLEELVKLIHKGQFALRPAIHTNIDFRLTRMVYPEL